MSTQQIDTTDLDRWVGQPAGGVRMRYPVAVSDIKRWVQALHNPNPLYFDEAYAAESPFGGIIAPQSFTVVVGDGHGGRAATRGKVPGSRVLFAGDEWWFYGPRIRPGDSFQVDGMLLDYKIRDTSFAGPAVFSRGDTTYVNTCGEFVAKHRHTSIRYIMAQAASRAKPPPADDEPNWTEEDAEALMGEKLEYHRSYRELGHGKRLWSEVVEGDPLPRRAIGPHSHATFATEWRARATSVWGASESVPGPTLEHDQGTGDVFAVVEDMARMTEFDPSYSDGLYNGPGRGHGNSRYARMMGMPRSYGYGSTIGAWLLDYVGNWAGEWGSTVHAGFRYRAPVLVGDITYCTGTVTEKKHSATGEPVVSLAIEATDQTGKVVASGSADVRLPDE